VTSIEEDLQPESIRRSTVT